MHKGCNLLCMQSSCSLCTLRRTRQRALLNQADRKCMHDCRQASKGHGTRLHENGSWLVRSLVVRLSVALMLAMSLAVIP